MARIVLGITGSIAAYKAADIASGLVKLGHDVHCVCTDKSLSFIPELTLRTLSRNPVYSGFDDDSDDWVPPHIHLASEADILLVAPASANTIAQFAHGLAPDMLSSLYLACRAPVMICPAMNSLMWSHPATQNNIRILQQRDKHHIFGPQTTGILACGAEGIGKLMPVDAIVEHVKEFLSAKN